MGHLVVVERTISFSTKNTGWLGSDRGVTMLVVWFVKTVGITSDWPWKFRRTIQLPGNQIWVNHWKLRVGVLTLRNSFKSTGSLYKYTIIVKVFNVQKKR